MQDPDLFMKIDDMVQRFGESAEAGRIFSI